MRARTERRVRIAFTFTAHGFDIYRKAPLDFAKRAAAASALITVSEANAGYIAAWLGVPREHIFVVPCGVDTSFFARSSRTDERRAIAIHRVRRAA